MKCRSEYLSAYHKYQKLNQRWHQLVADNLFLDSGSADGETEQELTTEDALELSQQLNDDTISPEDEELVIKRLRARAGIEE